MRSEDVKTALSGPSLLPAGLRSGSAGRGKQLAWLCSVTPVVSERPGEALEGASALRSGGAVCFLHRFARLHLQPPAH